MRKNGPDINSFAIEVDYDYQPEFVATYVKDDELADLVDSSKCLFELPKILKILGPADRKPVS
jgi:hypothetical protein